MEYKLEIEIDQPREEVAGKFADLENLKFWQPGFVSAERISGEPGEEGSKTRLLYQNRGRDVEMMETLTRYRMPNEFSAIFETDGMIMEVENFFYETGDGNTRWVTNNTATVRGLMMRLITILMPGCFKRQSWEFMENFKAFVETGADVRENG